MTIQNQWDTTDYEKKHDFVYHLAADLLEWKEWRKGESVLDLGCGTGQLTHEIYQKGCSVIGLDYSSDMVKKATINYPHIQFNVGDATEFALENPVDTIFSNATLHWVKPPEKAVACMYNALRPNGELLIEFGGQNNVQGMLDGLRIVLKNRGLTASDMDDLWYFPSIGTYTSLLESKGFLVKKAVHIDRPTILKDSVNGMIDWFNMFGDSLLKGISSENVKEILIETQEVLRSTHFHNGQWVADYNRIRLYAIKR